MLEPLLPVTAPPGQGLRGGGTSCHQDEGSVMMRVGRCRFFAETWRGQLKALQVWVVHWLRRWWRVTTDAEYLRSRLSRRRAWKTTLCAIVALDLSVDVAGAATGEDSWWMLMADMPFALAVLGYGLSSMGPDSLLVDFVLTALLVAVIGGLYVGGLTGEVDGEGSISWMTTWVPGIMAVSAFAGLHSVLIVTLWLSSVVWCLTFAPSAWELLCATTVIGTAAVAMEFTIAVLFCEWRRESRCTEALLEGATDGFGAVDCVTGEVLSASPKLQETLGVPLVGGSLQCGVVHARDADALAKFMGDAAQAQLPEPVLITWSAGSFEVDVRMVPYHLLDSRVDFCVQSVGEKRRSYNSGPAEAEAGRDEVSLAADASQPPQRKKQSRHQQQQQQQRQPAAPSRRSRGTLSLSSWSISLGSTQSTVGSGGVQKKKKVETRTFGVQVDLISCMAKPPAPLEASTVPREQQVRAMRRKRLAKAWKSSIVEGQPILKHFEATPKATRGNGLSQLVQSFNNSGKGCCARHIAWMGVQEVLTQEMLKPCDRLAVLQGWQCPECLALNSFEAFEEVLAVLEEETYQVCALCHQLVEPRLPEASGGDSQLRSQTAGENTSPAAIHSSCGADSSEAASPGAGGGSDSPAEVDF